MLQVRAVLVKTPKEPGQTGRDLWLLTGASTAVYHRYKRRCWGSLRVANGCRWGMARTRTNARPTLVYSVQHAAFKGTSVPVKLTYAFRVERKKHANVLFLFHLTAMSLTSYIFIFLIDFILNAFFYIFFYSRSVTWGIGTFFLLRPSTAGGQPSFQKPLTEKIPLITIWLWSSSYQSVIFL